ncbi:MAG: hypothetical protein O6941_08390, partial [Planctomycetota bacterium]|nr:hypothetical protein [Planctomycetota bacterium]
LCGTAVADILHVPGDYRTIQEAMDAAMDGDEVEVHPGTYNETINFLGKAITVRSSDGPQVTIIDAQQTGTVVTCNSGEGPDTVLGGFTVTGGGFFFGNGMYNFGSSPTVTNCTFSGNSAYDWGGGMYNDNSSPTVTNCTFSGNTVSGFLGGRGGGMYNFASSPTVTNCVFSANSATAGELGPGSGGGMYNLVSSPTVTNCTFNGNTADRGGVGGMHNLGGSPSVTNCILWGNSPKEISGAAAVRYSDVAGGFAGLGNIDADPMFVDPINGDFRLLSGSPCADAGNNWGVPIDADDYDQDGNTAELFPVDLDGNPRFNADEADFDPGCGVPVVVDMGAYEYQFNPVEEVIFADLNADGVVGILDLLGVLAAWGDAKNNCLADLDIDGDVGILDLLTLLSNWG